MGNHEGNVSFRVLIQLQKRSYVTSSISEKKKIASNVLEMIKNKNPPGRFLELDPKIGLWKEASDTRALKKTSQALREGQANLRSKILSNGECIEFLKSYV